MAVNYKTDVIKIIRKLERQGWRVEKRKHFIVYPPNKMMRQVTVAVSPSDFRSIKNIKSELRRSGAII